MMWSDYEEEDEIPKQSSGELVEESLSNDNSMPKSVKNKRKKSSISQVKTSNELKESKRIYPPVSKQNQDETKVEIDQEEEA